MRRLVGVCREVGDQVSANDVDELFRVRQVRGSVDRTRFNTQGLTGQIKVTVTADGLYSSTYSGHSRWEYAGHVSQSHGMWTSQSAAVSGNVLGFQFGSAAGSIGENRDRQMQIDRGTK
jgi:hypothetical protein